VKITNLNLNPNSNVNNFFVSLANLRHLLADQLMNGLAESMNSPV